MNKEFNNLIIYQVMVTSFQDGDNRIGYETDYGSSGFKGVKDALPYIKELNVNMI
jgi:glycosidase